MRYTFGAIEFVLVVAGIALAAAWYYYPEGDYDKFLALSLAILALVEFLRRKFKDEPQQERDRKERKSYEEKVAKALSELTQAEQKMTAPIPQSASVSQPEVQPPPEDLEKKQYVTILNSRDDIKARLQEYAKLHQVNVTNQSGQELLDLVHIDKTFRDGIRNYLDTTTDLVHLSGPMVEWAATNGATFVGVLDMLIRNAKTPAP